MSAEIPYLFILEDYSRRRKLPVEGRDASIEEQKTEGRRLKAELDVLQPSRIADRSDVFNAATKNI